MKKKIIYVVLVFWLPRALKQNLLGNLWFPYIGVLISSMYFGTAPSADFVLLKDAVMEGSLHLYE